MNIIVIGAGLTGLTTAYHLVRKGFQVTLIEQSDRVGGQIQTFEEQGFLFESGPNTGVISHPEVAELFQALAPDCLLETAHEEAKRRLIWKGARFHAIPSSLPGGITTPLFTWKDKCRILGEPFRRRGSDPDEPVGELARRRLGQSFLDYAVDPFLSGVYAGDPMKLTTRYALPKLYKLEQEHGSFIKGAIAKARQPKSEREKLATKQVFSARGGLNRLVDALANAIGRENILLSASDIQIQPQESRWSVRYRKADQHSILADRIITTCGAYSLPALLPFVAPAEMQQLNNLQYAPIVQAAVGVRDTGKLRFNAFGGLVPSREGREVLGILFPSACFDHRAPESGALFSFFIGGMNRAELIQLPDRQIEELIIRNFHEMLHFPAHCEPEMIRLFRHPQAIPQYHSNSGLRFAAIDRLEAQHPGLFIGGNLKGGIGMADRICQGAALAARQ